MIDRSSADFEKLHRLVMLQLDGEAAAEDMRELMDFLRDDKSRRQLYVETIHDVTSLRWWSTQAFVGALPVDGVDHVAVNGVNLECADGNLRCKDLLARELQEKPKFAGDLTVPNPAIPLTEPVSPLQSQSHLPWLFPSWSGFSLGMFSLLLVAVSGVGFGVWAGLKSSAFNSVAENRQDTSIAHGAPEGLPVVTSLKTASSTTTMQLLGIGVVTIDEQTDFHLIGPKRARLNRGRIKVLVSEASGRGFVVETPDGEVTDLGTEFGVKVAQNAGTELLVFHGAVDLLVGEANAANSSRIERLRGGEGMLFDGRGQRQRVMSIFAGNTQSLWHSNIPHGEQSPTIASVSDNLGTSEVRGFYEIVPNGLEEDVLAYVDRGHQWNGIDATGLPKYLRGADYVKMFNNDKMRSEVQIDVTLSQPARLFVFFYERLEPPDWLKQSFRNTGDRIGMDMGNSYDKEGRQFIYMPTDVGPGKSVEEVFCVWEHIVREPGVVRLGANTIRSHLSAMYCIAAVPLNDARTDSGVNPGGESPLQLPCLASQPYDLLRKLTSIERGEEACVLSLAP